RATRRLISRFLMKFGKADKKELRDPKNWKELVNRLSPDEAKIILEAVQEHIYGFDINPFACHIAEMNMLFQVIDLYQRVREKYPDYKLKRFKIYRTDSLEKPTQKQLFDWTHKTFLEEQEEIDAIKNKKFDFVVENPPYVRKERIPKLEKEKLSKNYPEIYHGDNDYYVYFLYASIKWLKDTGKFGVIVSSKFTKTRYGKYIRAFIVENTHISKFIDLRGSKVFANVTVDPCILILDKEKSNEIRVIKVKKDFEEESWEKKLSKLIWHIFKNGTKDYQDEYIKSFTVDQSSLIRNIKQENRRKISNEWKFLDRKELQLLNKIDTNSTIKLNEISEINCGVKTGKDDVFILKLDDVNKLKLEKSLLKPILDGKDIRRYKILYKNTYLIFTENINLVEFPNVKLYLEQFKEKLEGRSDIKNTNKKWYELRPCNYYNSLSSEKIITPDISMNNNFAYDDGNFFIKNTAYFIKINKDYIKTKYILGLLNSKVLEFFFKHISVYLGKSGYRYTKQHLNKLPIKLPETPEEKKISEQIIKKVDEILELHKKGIVDIDAILEGEETEKLYNLPKVTFNIKDDAKFEKIKVENDRIFISSQDFIEIKDRLVRDFVIIYLNNNKEKLARIKDIKKFILNISVPKSEEVLKEISKKGMTDQEEIRNKIKQLEKEIDELVYKLYGITDEEKKIIEEYLK
ncbi:MAG: TaqI-like C-terminal specificity domain-containing protein, partial [Candidatus Aenigmatarchaeota archaeon]